MELTTQPLESTETSTDGLQETVEVSTDIAPGKDEPTKILTPEEQLQALTAARTGNFTLKMDLDTVKWYKNFMQAKVEWKGPNEAYLVIITTLSLDSIIASYTKETTAVQLSASTVETLNYFISKYSSTGRDSAQKLFSAVMQLRPVIEKIRVMDEEIEKLKVDLKSEKK